MRSAIVATPALLSDMRPAAGALDGDLIRARLPLPDAGFHVIDLDPGRDLAEQLDVLYDTSPPEPDSPLMFYASCSVALAIDGELFLCLDPSDLSIGDSLKDVASVLRDRHRGPLLLIIECRHTVDADDPFRSATVVEAAKSAITTSSGVELLVAAHPLHSGEDDRPSPFTRAFVEALDDADPDAGLSVRSLYEAIRDSGKLLGAVPSFTYVRGSSAFHLIPPSASGGEGKREGEAAPDGSAASDGSADASASGEAPADDASSDGSSVDADGGEDVELPAISLATPELMASAADGDSAAREASGVAHERPPIDPIAAFETTASVPVTFEVTAPVDVSEEALGSENAAPTFADHLARGDALAADDPEGALEAFKEALGLLSGDATRLRAEIFIRIATVKASQEKRREAIAHLEKALQALPTHRKAIDSLVELTFLEQDWQGLAAAEERLFAVIIDQDELFARLLAFAERWGGVALDAERAQALLERARGIHPADVALLTKLRKLYEAMDLVDEALDVRRRLAEVIDDPKARAREQLELGRYCLDELKREAAALELFDAALDSDPTNIEPLAIVERILEERQEWSELEQTFRRMLERLELCPRGQARTDVSWDICRRLAFLYRDHLEDPASSLLSFEDALGHRPDDLDSHCVAAELARTTGRLAEAATHIQAMASLDPTNTQSFHDLFEVFQKLRRPDHAFSAACVTSFLRCADARERIIYEEHAPDGTPPLVRALREGSWSLLRTEDSDKHVEAILSAVSSAAVAAKIATLDAEGRLPALDPATREDPEKSMVSIVRSFVWGSHFLGVPSPSVYLREGASFGLAAVMAAEPSVVIGNLVIRGRSMSELAFLVGRHLAYHVGSHRLLLYYPSLDELSVCFLATLRVALPSLPIPANFREGVLALAPRIEGIIKPEDVKRIQRAVADLDASGKPADITRWVSGVEHCAARAGYLLCGSLEVAAQIMKSDPLGMVPAEEKVNGIVGFTISDAYHALREELGIAIEP